MLSTVVVIATSTITNISFALFTEVGKWKLCRMSFLSARQAMRSCHVGIIIEFLSCVRITYSPQASNYFTAGGCNACQLRWLPGRKRVCVGVCMCECVSLSMCG